MPCKQPANCALLRTRFTKSRGARATPVQVQFDVAFTWRPLAPVHGLLASLPVKGLQLPAFTSDHTITLTVDSHSR